MSKAVQITLKMTFFSSDNFYIYISTKQISDNTFQYKTATSSIVSYLRVL